MHSKKFWVLLIVSVGLAALLFLIRYWFGWEILIIVCGVPLLILFLAYLSDPKHGLEFYETVGQARKDADKLFYLTQSQREKAKSKSKQTTNLDKTPH